jgi:hypothetical protein
VSLKVAAAVAHHLVAARVGTLPADFHAAPSSSSSSPRGAQEGSVAQWVEYVGRHMWHPSEEPAALRSGAPSAAGLQRAGSLSAKL